MAFMPVYWYNLVDNRIDSLVLLVIKIRVVNSDVTVAEICNSVSGGVLWHVTVVLVPVANMGRRQSYGC